MFSDSVAVVLSLLYCSLMLVIFLFAVRRSPFGWIILSVEYFYFLGLGVFPILVAFNLINNAEFLAGYNYYNGGVMGLSFVHVLFYSIGAVLGYFSLPAVSFNFSARIERFVSVLRVDNYKWFYITSLFSIFVGLLYFYFVGFGNAVANASLARGGDFSGLVGFEKYQFLKRLAMLGGLSMVFVPFIILDGKRVFSSFLFIFVIALLIYLQTVSRVIFLETVAVFILLFFSLRQRKGGVFYLCLVPFFVFFAFVFLYGKTFVASLSLYFSSGGDFNLIEGGSLESQLSKFFGHFGHLIYSVDAGIRNYFAVGPVFPDDVLLAPIGIIPSFMLSSVGLDWLSYQLVPESERMSCINSGFFSSSNGCMVPPYFSGFSAYLMPLGGALIFGFFRFWIYSVIEACWVRFRARPELIWFAYLLFIVFNQIMLIIPATISFSFFVVILFLALLFVRRLLLVRF